jgi:hypothetical protein
LNGLGVASQQSGVDEAERPEELRGLITDLDRAGDEKSPDKLRLLPGRGSLVNEPCTGKYHLVGYPQFGSKVCKSRCPALPARSRIISPTFFLGLLSNNLQRL